MTVRKGGLGRGLDAMISETAVKPKTAVTKKAAVRTTKVTKKDTEEKVKEEGSVLIVKMTQIEPNRSQPRKQFDEDALLELSESIKQFGVLQPLLVQKKGDYYEIIAGERRWRASKLAGLKEVPVIVKDFSEQETVEISLIENIQRENLNPIEEAAAYKRLMEEFHLKQDVIAERVSKSRTAVTNSMRLLKLDERVQQMLVDEMLTTGHARALLAIENKDEQHAAAVKVFDEKLNVRETEKLVKLLLNPAEPKPEKEKNFAEDLVYEQLEEKIKGIIGSKVAIRRKNRDKGKIEIEYYSQEELERIVELLETVK
ncbi:ParB/RepB/Spo0J family partition protein [Blautia hansenii]|uniref:ParB/RepB/Spo0J family partition protein n=1 Tax=Blautia hansenii TaxID=1322 RepID=A0ABX2I911_BLAHA|nr:ParB/RepB/Spo0J family partition protein [Blautia hansenii]MCB5601441.1 ParB/RepB/Spo0J family partition protein [Blautia hansenii]NSJ86835.1 ParB/RepB/Spo0J family partition protein [Blautia hansenii]